MPKLLDKDRRRRELAEALWAVVLRDGISAVSVRTVADEAGVSAGSLRHVFPTQDELLVHSAELVIEHAEQRLAAVPKGDALPYAGALLRELLPLTPQTRAEMQVNAALVADAARTPRLAELRDDAHAGIGELTAWVVESLTGAPDATAARRLHALVDGLAFHLLHQPPDADPAWALGILDAELRALAERPRAAG